MSTKPKRIMLVYTALIPSVYLCGYVQLQYLCEHGFVEFEAKRFADITKDDVLRADIVLFIRNDSLQDVWLAKQCRKAGKYLIYVLDDDLLNVPSYISSARYYQNPSVREQIKQMMSLCDCFMSPSEVLLAKYEKRFSRVFRVIEPSVMQVTEITPHQDGRVHIGFAGSADRGKDLDEILGGAIETVIRKYPERVIVEIFGPETELSKRLELKTYPYLDAYSEYQSLMKELHWDIGLAPMPDSAFHRCKHCNKLVEYAGFGIVGIYSDVIPYSNAVEDGVTGLLCEDTENAWTAAISRLVEDGVLRKSMQENCLRLAGETYSIERTAMELLEQLQQCGTSRQPESNLPLYTLQKLWIRAVCLGKRVWLAVLKRTLWKIKR